MKTTTSLLLFVFALSFSLTGCFDSTGQESDRYDEEIAQDQTDTKKRTRRGGDDDWDAHRKNFGDRRTTSSNSDADTDWSSESYSDSEWDNEEFDRSMDEIKKELDGLVDLDELENKLKSIERDFEERGGKIEGLEDVDWDQIQTSLDEAFENLGEGLSEISSALSNGSEVESIDYNELKDVLPSRVRGFEKKNFNGDKVSVFGINLSVLEQEYESDKGGQLDITLIDLGSLANAALVGLDWLDLEVKSESSTGFEQTTTIDGYPAFEECDRSYGEDACSLHLVVEDRFVVQIESNQMGMKDIKGVLDKMDIRKLEKMSQ